MATRIQVRRGGTMDWGSVNPILSAGEIGYDTGLDDIKVGDGTTAWNDLPYINQVLNNSSINHATIKYSNLSNDNYVGAFDDPMNPTSFLVFGATELDDTKLFLNSGGDFNIRNNNSNIRIIPNSAEGYTTQILSDLEVEGSLTVSGSVTTINSSNLNLTDSLLYLAEGNSSNIIDIGLIGSFTSGSEYQHTGFVRDATDNTWKLFSSVEDEPTTTVNFSQGIYDNLQIGNLFVSSITATGYIDSLVAIEESTSASITLTLSNSSKIIKVNNSSANNVYIPLNSTAAFPIGTQISITQTGTGQTTIVPASTVVTLNTPSGLKLRNRYSTATLVKTNTDEWLVMGDVTT